MTKKTRIRHESGRAMSKGLADILRVSCRLMASKGFHGTSMRDLAQATGRSVSGLYHYFRGKEDLLFLINHEGFTRLNDSWAQLKDLFETPEEALYAFIFFHTGYFAEHRDQMKVMTWGTQAMSVEKARIIQSLKNQYTEGATSIVRQVCGASEQRPADVRRLERLTFLLFGMMNWIFTWYSPRRHGDAAEVARDIFGTSMWGLREDAAARPNFEAAEAVVKKWWRSDRPAPERARAGRRAAREQPKGTPWA